MLSPKSLAPAREPARMTALPDFTQVPDLMMPSALDNSSEAHRIASSQPAAPAAPAMDVARMPEQLTESTTPAPELSTLEQARELARVTAEDIKAFARQFDPQPFHLDEAAAQESFFTGLAASGWHTAALVMRLTVESDLHPAGGTIGAGVENLRWPRAVRG